MNGEFISIDTAERIAKLEKENKRLKNGLKKAINKICEQDVKMAQALEYMEDYIKLEPNDLNLVPYAVKCEFKEVIKLLKGERNEIR